MVLIISRRTALYCKDLLLGVKWSIYKKERETIYKKLGIFIIVTMGFSRYVLDYYNNKYLARSKAVLNLSCG